MLIKYEIFDLFKPFTFAVKFITVSGGNLHFQTKKYSTVLEAMRTCKQITKSANTLGEMIWLFPRDEMIIDKATRQ